MAEDGEGGPCTETSEQLSLVVRLNIRLCLILMMEARKVAADDLTGALLLGGVMGANLDHLDQRPEDTRRYGTLGSVDDDERRPVNAKSLSDALGVPRETARAKVGSMVDAGILRRLDHGVILPRSTIQSPEVAALGAAYFAALNDVVSNLALAGACGLCQSKRLAEPVLPVAGAAIRLGVNHVLRTMMYARSLIPGFGLIDVFVLLSVVHLTGTQPALVPGLGHAREGKSGPHLEPAPVRGTAVATFLDMPEETVRRHLATLVDHCLLIKTPQGFDIQDEEGFQRRWLEFQNRNLAMMVQFMWRLRQAGVIVMVED